MIIVAGTGVARATSSRGIPNVIDQGDYGGHAWQDGDGGAGEDKKETREVHVIIITHVHLPTKYKSPFG